MNNWTIYQFFAGGLYVKIKHYFSLKNKNMFMIIINKHWALFGFHFGPLMPKYLEPCSSLNSFVQYKIVGWISQWDISQKMQSFPFNIYIASICILYLIIVKIVMMIQKALTVSDFLIFLSLILMFSQVYTTICQLKGWGQKLWMIS